MTDVLKMKALGALFPNSSIAITEDGRVFVNSEVTVVDKADLDNAIADVAKKAFIESVKSEIARRILSHASQGTQMNMVAAAAGGLLSAEQLQAFRQGLQWVSATRAKGKELIEGGVQDFTNDEHWPKPSAAAVALASEF